MRTIKRYIGSAAIISLTLILASCGSETSAESQQVSEDEAAVKEAPEVGYYVSGEESTLTWKGTLLGVYSHEGTLDVTKGKFSLKGDEIVSGTVRVDMNTITPTDDNYSEDKTAEMLVGHLSSDDFFAVADNPQAQVKIGDGKAHLSLRGVTDQIKIEDIDVKVQEGGAEVNCTFVFDRTKFGAMFKTPGEAILSNEVQVNVTLRGVVAS